MDVHDDQVDDEFDPQLEQLFRREHTHLPAEPFSAATLRAIAADRKRVWLRTRVLQAGAVIALLILSPRLLDATAWAATRLDGLIASASGWLASPAGLIGAGLCGLVALATKWARIW